MPSAAEPAGVDDRQAVAVLRLVQIVRRHQHGDAVGRERVDERPETSPRERIDAAGRLVEKDDRRLVQDGAAEREPLPPPPARSGGASLAPFEAGHLDDEAAPALEARRRARRCRRRSGCSGRRSAARRARSAATCSRCAASPLRISLDVHTADRRGAGGRREQAAEHADRRRLPGAVAPRKPKTPRPHVERDMVDGNEVAEAARQIAVTFIARSSG